MEEKDLNYLKLHLNNLFINENERDISRDFKYISDYYNYLASCIDYQELSINADSTLLEEFEAIHLWLQEKLLLFPDPIKSQVDKIFDEHNLCDVFSIIANLNEEHIWQIKRSQRISRLPKIYSIFGVKLMLPPIESQIINYEKFFAVKRALTRLSQVLKYASSLNISNFDQTIYEFKSNYDPELINKNKLFTLISYLRVQIESDPDNKNFEKVSKKLDSLEAEIKRPKVRWAVVITGFFVLMGFLADLKTLSPDIYSNPHKTVESIIHVLHADGMVQESMAKNLLEHKNQDQNDNHDWPDEDPPIRKNEEDLIEIKD